MRLSKIWTSESLPLDLDEVKLDLRVDSNDDDGTISRMISAAADFAEIRTGLVFAAGTYEVLFDDFDCCFPCRDRGIREFHRAPLRSVNAISYLSGNAEYTDLDLADFMVSNRGKSFAIGPLSTFSAPTLFEGFDCVRVTFDAGYDPADQDSGLSGDPIPLPGGLKTMLTMIVGHYYKNRELFDADKIGALELGAGSLLGAYRQFW